MLLTQRQLNRKVYPVVPPKVEYSLTPLGRTLIKPLTALCQWAETSMHQVAAARSAYLSNIDGDLPE